MSSPTTPSLVLPAPLARVLHEKDSSADDFDETEVSFVLERVFGECDEISEGQRKASVAEIVALQMPLVDGQERSTWGTRFGPVVEGTRQDGTPYSFPDLTHIDAEVVQYWKKRAT